MKFSPIARWRERLRRIAARDQAIARHPAARSHLPLTPPENPSGSLVQYYNPHGQPVSEATARALASRSLEWRSDFAAANGAWCTVITRWRHDPDLPYETRLVTNAQVKGIWRSDALHAASRKHQELIDTYAVGKVIGAGVP